MNEPTNIAFLNVALTQVKKPYVFGAEASASDPDPPALDCSEFIEWAVHRAGGEIPDGAINQFNHCDKGGGRITVAEALKNPGALLFKEDPANKRVRIYHVGISMGNGLHVLEARGVKWGVGIFPIGRWAEGANETAGCWNLAAKIPGVKY